MHAFFSSCRHTVRSARQGGFASAQCAINAFPSNARDGGLPSRARAQSLLSASSDTETQRVDAPTSSATTAIARRDPSMRGRKGTLLQTLQLTEAQQHLRRGDSGDKLEAAADGGGQFVACGTPDLLGCGGAWPDERDVVEQRCVEILGPALDGVPEGDGGVTQCSAAAAAGSSAGDAERERMPKRPREEEQKL